MKVFVAGASGRVAQLVIEELLDRGHEVTAGLRNPAKLADAAGVSKVALDLHASVEDLREVIRGSEAIYFTAGSRGQDLLQTDAFGAVKLMQAAEAEGISRFIMLSSVFADRPEKWTDPALSGIMNYNIAKFFADQWLMHRTQLDYTIVQPGNLMEEPASGLVRFNVTNSQPNSIGNVAKVLAETLEQKQTIGQILTMSDGATPIDQAFEQLKSLEG